MFAYIPHKIISLLIDNILNGSLKILAAKGYENATIADISKSANVSRGLLHYYHYYSSDKEDCVSNALTEL
jgi:TetR/AcrR family transcriptional regulator, fatty acid metabolism regulator protein